MTFNFKFIVIRFTMNGLQIVLSAVVIFYEIKHHANSVFKVMNYFRYLSGYDMSQVLLLKICQNSAKLFLNSSITQ